MCLFQPFVIAVLTVHGTCQLEPSRQLPGCYVGTSDRGSCSFLQFSLLNPVPISRILAPLAHRYPILSSQCPTCRMVYLLD